MQCTVPGTRVYCSARNIDTLSALSTDEGFSGFLPSFQKGKVYYSKEHIMKCLHYRGWLSMTIRWLGKKLESVVRTYRASVWAKQIKLSVMIGGGGIKANQRTPCKKLRVIRWKTALCIIIKVHSVKSELPKSSIVYKINWRKQIFNLAK